MGEGAEPVFAEVLDEVAGLQRVLVDSHFFDDLCADTLAMARFCARVRKREELPSVSMKDIYRNPTIRSLASTPGGTVPAASAEPSVSVLVKQHRPVSSAEYLMRGALQLLFFVGYAYLAGAAAFLIVSATLSALQAGTGRKNWAQGCDRLPERAGVHRSAVRVRAMTPTCPAARRPRRSTCTCANASGCATSRPSPMARPTMPICRTGAGPCALPPSRTTAAMTEADTRTARR